MAVMIRKKLLRFGRPLGIRNFTSLTVHARCMSDLASGKQGLFRQDLKLDGITIVSDEASAQRALDELNRLKDRPHAWDTETANIRVGAKGQSPVHHGRILCATCFCGDDADFGNGPRLFVDNDGYADGVLATFFREYFEEPQFKKVFHNYSFDAHMLARHQITIRGFWADTLHLARLVDTGLGSWEGAVASSTQQTSHDDPQPLQTKAAAAPKRQMRVLLGGKEVPKLRHVHAVSNLHTMSAVEDKQASERSFGTGYGLKRLSVHFGIAEQGTAVFKEAFGRLPGALEASHNSPAKFPDLARYATEDARLTYQLYDKLWTELQKSPWFSKVYERDKRSLLLDAQVAKDLLNHGSGFATAQNCTGLSMWDLSERYLREFGQCLFEMEQEGIRVDADYLLEAKGRAQAEFETYHQKFATWCATIPDSDGIPLNPDAQFINIRSSTQLQVLLFGGVARQSMLFAGNGTNNAKDLSLPKEKDFPLTKEQRSLADGRKVFTIRSLGLVPSNKRAHWTETGWPSVSGEVLRDLVGSEALGRRRLCEAMGIQKDKSFRNDSEDVAAKVNSYAEGLSLLNMAMRAHQLLTGFIQPMLECIENNGRIHPSWAFDTSTGRLACRRPNLQNVPACRNDPYGIRNAFRAGPGKAFVVADYSQLELRVLAHITQSQQMIDMLSNDGDYHSQVAADIFPEVAEAVKRGEVAIDGHSLGLDGVPLPTIKDCFPNQRAQAKAVNFSITYGVTANTVAEDLNISPAEASAIMKKWYQGKPEVQAWMSAHTKEARRCGRVRSILGRWRTLPHIAHHEYSIKAKSERAAVNYGIQGSAADIVMAAMLRLRSSTELSQLGFRLVLQVHDEFVLEGPAADADKAKEIVRDLMENPFSDASPDFTFHVPMIVQIAVGSCWTLE